MVIPRTQCISIIDESIGNQARNNYNQNPPPAPYPQSVSNSTQAIANDWNRFRDLYPNNGGNGREFWLLQPGRSFPDLLRPSNYISDSLTHTVTVNRDGGSVANRSDWFSICNLDTQPPGSFVAVWLDVSGSMVLNTVRASYDYFFERCADAGIEIVLTVSDRGERWSADHAVDFAPSASFSTDPDFLTNFNEQVSVTIPYGGSATLSWIVFGDTTSANITGVGDVSDPSGTITVSPAATTNYQLEAVGPVGNTIRVVTVVVLPPPPPTVTFSVSPSSYVRPGQATLSWQIQGVSITDIDINEGIGDVLPLTVFDENGIGTGSIIVNPNITRTYTITAKNFGGAQGSQTTRSVILTVYEPTVANIVAVPNPISVGQQTNLQWTVTGDATEAFISPPVTATGEVLLASNANVSPNVSTRYTLTADGPGGFDEAFVDVKVCQIPTISGNFPVNIDYGEDFTVDITFSNAASGAGVVITYTNTEGVTTSETRNVGSSASDENSTEETVTFNSNIPWDDFGPQTIVYQMFASGCGGTVFATAVTVNVYIDKLPDLINIPDSLDKIPLDQVVAPENDVVLSDPIFITDIDIPVEIKSDHPIEVRFDNDDPNLETNWKDVRRI
ncbi:virion structural protein [Prochlorococcus phage Syn1]|uniref:Virion structural protein n=1 Tax=Prochlorococcus phage Syn1 TaxID=444861 RepID=E3SPC0_9CAUD|nr:virion structural protein [Prochlorococcus phage Syn1]ADO99136.1 hypothetical protein Syn1_035 [Prochlorococcus phage Syn1]